MWCHVTFYLFPRALSGMIIISSGIVFMETKALHLREAFVYFLNENGLDPSIYTATGASLYKIYGIDAASGAVVTALDISLGDHDLDLCAAPGAKLCMISDFLGNSGSVTGVDVARHRLAACRTMLQKYALGDRCRLFVVDGTTFSRVHSNSRTWILPWKKSWILTRNGHLGDLEKKGKAQENSNLQLVPQIQDPELIFYGLHSGVVGLSKNELYQITNGIEDSHCGYDKNAHMISIKHIQKFENWGWTTLQWRVLNAERTDDLTVLRLLLLTNGFKLLKVGGSLVYSTCSLTVAQNEDVIEQFLLPNTSAELLVIDAAKKWPCKSGRIQKTLRFDPLTSQTSGFFVAKFTKLIF